MDQSLQILTQTHPDADLWKNSPITISQLSVVYDYTHNREALILQCTNTSPLSIRSLYFDMECYDDAGDLLGKATGVCMRNLDAQPNTVFGEANPIVIPYSGTCKVDLTLEKAVFCDNSVWRKGDALPTVVASEDTASTPEISPAPVKVDEPIPAPAPTPIPAEWQKPEASTEGYRAAIAGLATLDHPNASYLIKKFTALAEKLEAEAAEATRKEAQAKEAAEKESLYQSLAATNPSTIEEWKKLSDNWKAMGAYKDAPKRSADALKKIKSMKAAAKRIADKEAEAARIAAELKAAKRKARQKLAIVTAITLVSVTAIVLLFTMVAIPASKQVVYDDAEELLAEGKYCEAVALFEELGNYSDSKDRIRKIKFELTGNEDALFSTSENNPGCSIENGILSFDQTAYQLTSSEIRIPDYFDNQKVTQIGASFFSGIKTITKVILPPSVVAVGESAFDGCTALTSLEAPGLITTGKYVFRGCTALTEITLPDTLTSIGDNAFQGCTALKKVVLPEGLRTLSHSMFLGCTALTEIQMSSNLKEIVDYAFANCTALTKLTLPDTVTSIGSNAFLSCTKLSKLDLPANIASVGDKAFGNCIALTSLDLGKQLTKLPPRTFSGCTALTQVNLPETLTFIGYFAFENCTALKTVHYQGNEAQWAQIEIQNNNDALNSATVEFAN